MIAHQTADRLDAVVQQWQSVLLALDEAVVRNKPSPGRWSIAEVIGHLIDSACNNHQRFVRAQESDHLMFPKYEQNVWVKAANYHQGDWRNIVALWHAYNLQLAQMMRNIPDSKLTTPCTITPYDTCTLEFLVTDYLDHLLGHLDKISERLERSK